MVQEIEKHLKKQQAKQEQSVKPKLDRVIEVHYRHGIQGLDHPLKPNSEYFG